MHYGDIIIAPVIAESTVCGRFIFFDCHLLVPPITLFCHHRRVWHMLSYKFLFFLYIFRLFYLLPSYSNLYMATRNLGYADAIMAEDLNVLDIVNSDTIVFDLEDCVARIEPWRALPVPFWRYGLRPPPDTSLLFFAISKISKPKMSKSW